MILAIVGSRSFDDYDALEKFVVDTTGSEGIEITGIVSGGAKGADTLARLFAYRHGYPLTEHKPDWKTFGKRAGFIRNKTIIQECDVCFAFWDGESHGTKHDIELCKKYDKPCYVYEFGRWG